MLGRPSDVAYPGPIGANGHLNMESWGEGERVLLVHGSMSFGELAFSEQRPLADRWRLDVVDRRGFGGSPDPPGRVDFETDARDIAALLDNPAHLLGQSYGGVACLLAAGLRPDGVRSLSVFEPPAFALARGHPAVEAIVTRIAHHVETAQSLTEEAFLHGFLDAWGLDLGPPQTLGARTRRGVRSTMTERPPWEAEVPLDVLAAARAPLLVVRGAWDTVAPAARDLAGAAFAAVCAVLVGRLDAAEAVFPGAAHQPQLLGERFNDRVEAFWRAASEPA